MSGKLVQNIYFDNGVYRKLVARGNQNIFYNHYNSLISYVPLLDNGNIKIYFTWGSLLEAIGLGSIRRTLKPRLDLTAFYIQREDRNIFEKLDQLFRHTYQFF